MTVLLDLVCATVYQAWEPAAAVTKTGGSKLFAYRDFSADNAAGLFKSFTTAVRLLTRTYVSDWL